MAQTHFVHCEPLTAESFAPFGQVLAAEPDVAAIAVRDGEELLLNVLSYDHKPLVCDHLNAHHKATQALLPMGGQRALLVVAPPTATFATTDDLASVRAFVMDSSAGVNLDYGTWHWGPYPIDAHVDLLNLQGAGFANDNEIAYLERDLDVVVVAQLPGLTDTPA